MSVFLSKKNSLIYFLYYSLLFIALFVFFFKVHPLMPFDTDDWKYIGFERPPYPTIYQWNPTKLFPECFQPLLGMFAAYFLTPILGDYISALVVTHSLVISLFISGYFYFVQGVVTWKYRIGPYSGFCLIAIFALVHFIILNNNEHLFYSRDVNCYYNYIVPNLLCAGLVMWLICHDIKEVRSMRIWSILIFSTFLALFSNLYSTIILIAYIGAVLLCNLWACNKKDNHWMKKFISQNTYFLIVIFVWFVVQYIEASGVRANAYGYMLLPFGVSLQKTIEYFITHLHFSKWVIFFIASIIILSKICHYFKGNKYLFHIGRLQFILVISTCLSLAYLILLSSRVFPAYLAKGDVIFSYIFFILLLFALCMGYLTAKIPFVKVLYPFLLFFFLCIFYIKESSFKDMQHWNGTDLQTCEKFNRDVIEQVKTAELLGKDTVIIYVHNYNDGSNWPQDISAGHYIGQTLYKHGIIRHKIVTVYERKPTALDTKQ